MTTEAKRFFEQRERMVRRQLEARGIRDPRLLAAFREVPRHRFVNASDLDQAYHDHPLSIGYAQTISQPYMVATMLERLALSGSDRVLEIGTGSGYQTALLALLVAQVFSIERLAPLCQVARERMAQLGLENVAIRCADGTLGWPEQAPFDAIVVSAGAPRVPETLVAQLAEGGRIAVPVGDLESQTFVVVRRDGEKTTKETYEGCRFVPLIGAQGWPEAEDDTT